MSRLLLVLLAILAIFSTSASASVLRCPPNETWSACVTGCEPTCGKPDSRPCPLYCIVGCRCDDGLLRNSENQCVPPSEC